jgi:hypothetical protein
MGLGATDMILAACARARATEYSELEIEREGTSLTSAYDSAIRKGTKKFDLVCLYDNNFDKEERKIQ